MTARSLDPSALLATYRALAGTANATYLLASDLRILRTNPAWDQFTSEAASAAWVARWRRGGSVLDVFTPGRRTFYQDGFARAQATGERWDHECECDAQGSPCRLRMFAYPFAGGLVVTHAVLVAPPADAAAIDYVGHGVVTMCAHCRRVRHLSRDRWDWIPAYLADPPARVSHGLCAGCLEYYYGDG